MSLLLLLYITYTYTYIVPKYDIDIGLPCNCTNIEDRCKTSICRPITSDPKCIILNGQNVTDIKPQCTTRCENTTNVSDQCPMCETLCDKPICDDNDNDINNNNNNNNNNVQCMIECEPTKASWYCHAPKYCGICSCDLSPCDTVSVFGKSIQLTGDPDNYFYRHRYKHKYSDAIGLLYNINIMIYFIVYILLFK